MTISKAVEFLIKFCNAYPTKKLNEAGDNFEKDFRIFLRNHNQRNFDEVCYKIYLALKKGFLSQNEDADTYGDYFSSTELFSDYAIDREKKFYKFIYGLIGSALTVVGGLIGALITALA